MEKAAKKCEKDANIQKAKVKKVHQCHAMHHSCVHVVCSAVLVTLLCVPALAKASRCM